MRDVHRRSCQSYGLTVLALLAATGGCASDDRPTVWPPPDFALSVEELRADADQKVLRAVRWFQVAADGVVVYATAGAELVDAESGTRLPVYDRLAVYQLVPTCVRALARRVDRAGVLTMDELQGERGVVAPTSVVLRWQAFQQQKRIAATGRVHGAMADILAAVAAHLPDGEQIETPGVAERLVPAVLRGVPAPRADAAGSLAQHERLAVAAPDDTALLLRGFALACHLGRRMEAELWLQRWREAVARRGDSAFADQVQAGSEGGARGGAASPTTTALQRLLPGAGG